ncbi:hypothetical protein [Lactiplantibacillus daowaiensis]|uniref:Uncharacterized protein n=1 Tax=Lactiplantibacillus daowaiensis TaxID=2559918 RepID=A0ABW1S2V9_9LACO|nr:hypothetical protein [Lactiplantibacillus daowaiensis]
MAVIWLLISIGLTMVSLGGTLVAYRDQNMALFLLWLMLLITGLSWFGGLLYFEF